MVEKFMSNVIYSTIRDCLTKGIDLVRFIFTEDRESDARKLIKLLLIDCNGSTLSLERSSSITEGGKWVIFIKFVNKTQLEAVIELLESEGFNIIDLPSLTYID
jgi:hypothetical protein